MHSLAVVAVLVGSLVHVVPRCLSLAEVRAAAGSLPDVDARLTPPLPLSWPPSGLAEVHLLDFRAAALPTGVVSYGIDSPSLELIIPLEGGPARRRSLGRRKRLGTWTPPVDAVPPPDAASELLLRLVCERRAPSDAEAAQLRAGYGAWLGGEPLLRGWLAPEHGRFFGWLSARPAPPPAPPGSTLTARVQGEAVVLSRGGVEVRLEQPGASTGQLMVVPARVDGSEPAVWIDLVDPQSGPRGLLVRYANPPQVQYTHVFNTRTPGISSTYRSVWLLDVDGDGWNDLVIHSTTRTDVGAQPDGVQVYHFDPLLNGYFPDSAFDKRAPRATPDNDSRPARLIAAALGVPEVQLRGKRDGHSVPLPSALRPDTLQGGGPPLVGADWIHQVLVKKKGQELGGHGWLVHVRYAKEPAVISTVDLGQMGFPPNGCQGRHEEFLREPGAFKVVWPDGALALVEQHVPWDGKTLGQPSGPPKVVGDCKGLTP